MNNITFMFMLIWGIGILCISKSAIKTFDENESGPRIIKVVALVLTIALAPLLAILQGIWATK